MKVLVTGGAGYIGAHVVRLLQGRGDDVVIVDDLVTGVRERVPGVPLHVMDLAGDAAPAALDAILREERVDAVIHFAGRKQVAESVHRPAWYFSQNIGSLANVLAAMETAGVARLIFSSSAAVYGHTEGGAISECDDTTPINPYGETKLVGEHLVTAAAAAFTLRAVSLRYFNVAGTGWPELRDQAVLNLVPMVFARLDAGLPPLIFGTDYPTPDGTCVRDYVHVLDLAEAHVAALDSTAGAVAGVAAHEIYNVGTGHGTSVRELITDIIAVAGSDLEPIEAPRRPGDPAEVVASVELIRERLGWSARLTVRDIVESAWTAHGAAEVSEENAHFTNRVEPALDVQHKAP